MTRSENTILMFSVILCWASTYIFIKQLPASLLNFAYLTMNFGIAAILLTIIFWKKIREIKKNNDSEIRGLKPDFDGQHLI